MKFQCLRCKKVTNRNLHIDNLAAKISRLTQERDGLKAELGEAREERDGLVALLKVAVCPACDGSGGIPKQVASRQYVTREMALDAGEPEMEGSLFSEDEWEQVQCQWCYEREVRLAALTEERE